MAKLMLKSATFCLCVFALRGCHQSCPRPIAGIEAYTPRGYRIRDEALKEIAPAQESVTPHVRCYFPNGLNTQAERIAQIIEGDVSRIVTATGLPLSGERIHVYLMNQPDEGEPKEHVFVSGFDHLGVVVGFNLFAEDEGESAEAILSNSSRYPAVVIHETVELWLSRPPQCVPLALDWRWTCPSGMAMEEINGTRWFREGFAEYCAGIALQATCADERLAGTKIECALLEHPVIPGHVALRRVGADLFGWNQLMTSCKDQPRTRVGRFDSLEYYSAAKHLFTVLEERFGQDAIKRIIQEIYRRERVNGEELIELVSQILGTDLVTLISEFQRSAVSGPASARSLDELKTVSEERAAE